MRPLFPVAVPLAVAIVMYRSPEPYIERAIAVVLAIGFLVLVQRRPERALLWLIGFIPFQLAAFSLAYRLGIPGAVLRPLGAYRDGIVIGVAVVAVRTLRAQQRRLDAIDKLALTLIAINVLYFAFPTLFVRPADDFFAGPTEDFGARALALRINATPPLLFLALRHLRPSMAFRSSLTRLIFIVGLISALASIYEFTFSDSWNNLAVSTLEVPRFQLDVLDLAVRDPSDMRSYVEVGGREFTRPGGVLFDPLPNGFYLLFPLAAGIRLLQQQKASFVGPALGLVSAALLLTYVRSALLAAAAVVLIALRNAGHRRVQLTVTLAAGVLFVLMTAAGTGYVPRFGDPGSDKLHRSGLEGGLETLADHPMGLGLGSAPGIGSQFQTTERVTAESAYLQVGNELGVIAMVVFVALVFVTLRRLLSARADEDAVVGWTASCGAALAIGGLFLHVWINITVALTFWAAAGTALASTTVLARNDDAAPPARL